VADYEVGAEVNEERDDWPASRRWVNSEIGRLSRTAEHTQDKVGSVEAKVDALKDDIHDVKTDVENLRFRQTVMGVIAAAVPSLVGAILWYITLMRH